MVATRKDNQVPQLDPVDVNKRFLPYARHCLDESDIAAVAKVLRGDWLTCGPSIDAFEAEFADRVGARHASAVANGTAALHLAALAAGLGPGDIVVVPAITFLATANAPRLCGATVVFADVDPETGLMTPELLERTIRSFCDKSPRAVFPVHLAGQVAEPEAIMAVARHHGASVIEDACHALGATYSNSAGASVTVGSCHDADAAIFSMHPIKTIAMGEGGVVTTNDAAFDGRVRLLRSHSITRDGARWRRTDLALASDGTANPWYYEAAEVGFNYRASDLHCALGLSQLRKLDRFTQERRRLAAAYETRLARLTPLVKPLGRVKGCDPMWHLFVVLIDFAAAGVERAIIMRRLKERGIGTQVNYIPVPWQPCYGDRARAYPGAQGYYERCLSLPLFVGMDEADVERVVTILGEVLSI